MGNIRSSAAYSIAINYAAFFAWTILLLGVTVCFFANAEFSRQRDRDVATEIKRLSSQPGQIELMRELKWRDSINSNNIFLYVLFDRKGVPILGREELKRFQASGLDSVFLLGKGSEMHLPHAAVTTLGDGSRLMVISDASAINRLNWTILILFFWAFVILLLIGVAGGWVLGRYLRSRLRPISMTANAIVTGDMHQRVPVGARGDEFDAAGHACNLMLDRIASLMENLRQVSSDIAHDLRKPLIRLLCQADRLGQVHGAEERVLEIGDEMLALFAAILRIAEVEGGDLERSFESIELSALACEVSESFAPALADAGNTITWTIEPGIRVTGSRELLAQVLANLLDNACVHAPAGTAITVGLASEEESVILWVADDGPGVAEADREKLFQRFFRTEASRTTPGNGLGLSLVVAAIRAHNGRVWAEDAEPGLRIVAKIPRLRGAPELHHARDQKQGWFLDLFRRFSARLESLPGMARLQRSVRSQAFAPR